MYVRITCSEFNNCHKTRMATLTIKAKLDVLCECVVQLFMYQSGLKREIFRDHATFPQLKVTIKHRYPSISSWRHLWIIYSPFYFKSHIIF
jgi:hypothetical protein